jgi:hypothetical membrane protein
LEKTNESSTSRWTSSPRLAGTFLLAGGIINVLLNTIAEGTYPDYNLRTNSLSDLGALGAPTALLWDSMLFLTGLFALLGIIIFFRSSALNIPRRKLARDLFILPPLGIILVSLFPENAVPAIHGLGALMVFLLAGPLIVYSFRFTTSPFRYFSVLLGAISFGSTPLLGVSTVGFGLAERLIIYPLILWYITFAGYLMSR